MQTTLLGLAIAFIIALIAALVGPHFIDWNQFRPQFEAEATRVIGAPVRVQGALDARLLPSPSLRLRSVVVGGVNDPGKVRADKLDVEFSLGSLMRGEWRATELTINGVSLDVGLDSRGRIDWPVASGAFDLGSLAIDRLNLTGRVALHDAASRRTLELSDIAFGGDVRSLAGSIRGDGNFTASGVRYPFRISSSQGPDGNGTRIHFAIDPAERPLSVDLDGLLTFDARVPNFNGTVALSGPAETRGGESSNSPARRPWRMTATLKAEPAAARFEQIEASYGSEDAALKFTGFGDIKFGASPLLHAVLSARQLDADRLLASDKDAVTRILPALRSLFAAAPRMPLATRLEFSTDQIMVGGRPIQAVSADLRGNEALWAIDRLEFRAPGATRVTLGGRITQSGSPAATFDGSLALDSSDPDTFVAWLQGRSDVPYRSQKPLRAQGRLSIAADRIALEGIKAELEGGKITGRLSLAGGKTSRVEAELTSDRLDLNAAAPFVRAVAGPQDKWPDEGQVSLNIGQALSAGQEFRPLAFNLTYGPKQISLSGLKIGQQSKLALDGEGTFNRTDATGKLTLNVVSDSLSRIADMIAPVAPDVAARLGPMSSPPGTARLRFALDLDRSSAGADRTSAQAHLDLELPQLKGTVSVEGAPLLAAVRGIDLQALSRTEVTVSSKVSADHSRALFGMFGLDRMVAPGDNPAEFEGSVTGIWHAPIRLKAKLSGSDLEAAVQGTAEPWAAEPKAAANLTIRHANLAPLFGLKSSDARLADVNLSSHITLVGKTLTLGGLDGSLAGSRLRGKVAITLGDNNVIDGAVGLDTVDLAPALALAIGTAGRDPGEPLGRGWLQDWRGQIAFEALRGTLPGGLELRPFSGIVKADGQSLVLDSMKGKIGEGDVAGRLDARQTADGVSLNGKIQIKDVNGLALHYGRLAMPGGHVAAEMTLGSQGRSASALLGALTGAGVVTIDAARIPGLNPDVFDKAIAASDTGQATDDTRLSQVAGSALSEKPLSVASAQVSFNIRDGRLRVGPTALAGDGARALVSGGYDIAADQADIRATLTSTSAGAANNRPELSVFAVGPPNSLHSTVDVAALSSWLAVRAIDRETRRLDSLERGQPIVQSPPTISPPTTASLPDKPPSMAPLPSPPPADVPVPNRDPRRSGAPKPQAGPSAPPQANAATTVPHAAPLPAPIEVRPPPGTPRSSRPHPPLVLTPSGPATRPAF